VRVSTIAVAALVAMCLAAAAPAKGPDLARVYGASGCTTIRGPLAVDRLLSWMGATFTVAPVPRPAPYYRITLRDHGQSLMTLVYVPARHRIRVMQPAPYPFAPGSSHPYWRDVSARGVAVFGEAVAGLKPFSAPRAWR
jgi:hypothetical protein